MVDVRSKSATASPVIVKNKEAPKAAPAKQPAAPVAQAPARWGAPAAGAKPARDGFEAVPAKGKAAVKNEPRITSNEQQVDLRDAASRRELAIEATQVNDVSVAADNADDICGGASLASALVLASSSPETAQANATAMRKLLNARVLRATGLPAGVNPQAIETALGHLEKGTLSRNDLFHLQQGLYAGARSYGSSKDAAPGVAVGQMAALVSELKGRGASLGTASMVEVELSPATKNSDGTSHWVASTKEGLINTGSSTVPADWLSPKSPRFSGDVRVEADVKFRTTVLNTENGTRTRASASKGWAGSITPKDPNDIKLLTLPPVEEQLRLAASTFDSKKPQPLD